MTDQVILIISYNNPIIIILLIFKPINSKLDRVQLKIKCHKWPILYWYTHKKKENNSNNTNSHLTKSLSSYLGAGMSAWTVMRNRSMMKEQIRLELNISSLIWENWTNQRRSKSTSCALLYLVNSCLYQHLHLCTLSSMCVSLNTRVSGVMCFLCIRSLLRTSMACLMRLLISLEVECHMLGTEPFVKEAKICWGRIWWCQINQVGAISIVLCSLRLHCSCQWHSPRASLDSRFELFSGLWAARRGQLCSFPPESRWGKCRCCVCVETRSCRGRDPLLSGRCPLDSPGSPSRCGYAWMRANRRRERYWWCTKKCSHEDIHYLLSL